MEHVSTFCAISTVGIAATGLALGRVDRNPPRSGRFRRNTFSLLERAPATDTAVSLSSSVVTPNPSKPFLIAESESPRNSKFLRSSENGDPCQSEDPNTRKRSSFVGVRLRRRGQTLTNPPLRINEDPAASHSRRPSSSWLRRLSFQPSENGIPCQSPVSSTFSIAASQNNTHPSSQRRVPNKLVKRPQSQHSNAHPLFAQAPASPSTPPILRRPATSHQRSEAFRHKATHSLNFEPNFLPNSSLRSTQAGTPEPTDNESWRPYLSARPDGLTERLARRFSTATRPKDQGLRLILPSADAFPTLLMATSVTNTQPPAEVFFDESTPASPVQFRNPFQPIDTPQVPETPLSPESKDYEPSPSLDQADPKSPETKTGSSATDGEKPSGRPLILVKRRAISTPLPDLSNPERTILGLPRSNGRRNITDPDAFRRPAAALHTSFPISLPAEIMGPRRYPREHITRVVGQHPSTFESTYFSNRQRSKRHSFAASEPASTVIGSDDTRVFSSGEEDETDFSAFDSIRTHITTASTSGLHGPRIETIFDKSLPMGPTQEGLANLQDLISRNSFTSQPLNNRQCDFDADVTPIPQETADLDGGEDSSISFPPDLTEDEDACSMVAALPGELGGPIFPSKRPTLSLKTSNYDRARGEPLAQYDSRNISKESLESYPKVNIFDWSEQMGNDREVSGSDARPRTVHGKHGSEVRGSRAPGRKAPNTLHLRSQSVPVSREPTITNESLQSSSKFGTWGLGSKGVSEDWDSDFEFDDAEEGITNENIKPSKNIPRRGMIVPQSIMERQASLHGQFGHVRELTLLVEELKRLRRQASFLGLVRGPSSELWKEAEGIVDLATLDDEDNNNHSPPGSPSSLTFSFDDSEGESSNTTDPWKRASGESWQASISERSNPSPDPHHKDTSKSMLDLIYQQRVSHDPTFIDSQTPRPKKLPFDTQSLRDLVVRAGVVTRSLKEVIRKAEGVTPILEERTLPSNPPFSQIFDKPNDNISTHETPCIG